MPDWISRQLELQGLRPWWAVLGHGVALLMATALILWLNQTERRLVPPAVGRGLLALRLLVLALIGVTFLQPVQTWTINEHRAGRILIGIDQSQSMAAADPQASRGEQLRWARGAGMIGNEQTAERLDAWQQAFDKQQEPEWISPEEAIDAERREQLAAARRTNLFELLANLRDVPRRELARRLLVAAPEPPLEQLKQLGNVELFVFAGKVGAIGEEQLETIATETFESVTPETTDLAEALRSAPSLGPATRMLGIVLLTDGRQTAKASPVLAAAALGQLKVPVFPVLLGSTRRPKDLAIPSIDAPAMVYRGDQPLVKATLQTAGFEGETLTVELRKLDPGQDQQLVEQRTITPSGPLTPIEFQLPAAEIGRHAYSLQLPVREGETNDDNNSRSFSISVADDRARVLLIDGQPRWEFRYLEAAFARDERIDLHIALFDQPYLGMLPDTYFPRKLPAGKTSPFEDLDVVILGDVAPWQLDDDVWSQLEKFVADQGGTLVFSAGKEFLPAAHQRRELDRLLPMASWKRVDVVNAAMKGPPDRRGMRLELTPEAETQSMFHFAQDPADNRAVWESLPGPMWAWLGTAKPGATVWLTALPPEQAALAEERRNALIAHQLFGFGQVVWIGFDSTWRWRYRTGDKHHHQFWAQLVRWAASSKIAAGNEFARFGPERTEFKVGEDVVLRTRWSPQFRERYPRLSAQAEIFQSAAGLGTPFVTIDLLPKSAQPLQSEGRAVNLPPGDYQAKLTVKDADLGQQPVEASFSIRPPETPELVDITSNRELLAQIADASGGKLLLADEVHQLPQLLRPELTGEDVYRETPLWDHSVMLVLFFVLLTCEWSLRKWNGLP